MPMRPPTLSPKLMPRAWRQTRSAEERCYGREHCIIRAQVLTEEPLCRAFDKAGLVAVTTIADHIVPMSQGGKTIRSNYQGLCGPCHKAKAAQGAARRH